MSPGRRKLRQANYKKQSILALAAGLTVLLITFAATSLTNLLLVPDTSHSIENVQTNIQPDDIKPAECNRATVGDPSGELVSGGPSVSGTTGNDLLLADSSTTEMLGGDGDDCIVGGPNTLDLDGGNGDDVCIANNPLAVLTDCEP